MVKAQGSTHDFKYVNVPRAGGKEFWTWGCVCGVHGAGGRVQPDSISQDEAFEKWKVHAMRMGRKPGTYDTSDTEED